MCEYQIVCCSCRKLKRQNLKSDLVIGDLFKNQTSAFLIIIILQHYL